MNFKQSLVEYVLGFNTYADLPQVALQALEEGYDSPSLCLLAGLDSQENTFVLESYLLKALRELSIELPSLQQALLLDVIFYVNTILEDKISFPAGMSELENLVFHYQYRWEEQQKNRNQPLMDEFIQIMSLYREGQATTIALPFENEPIKEINDRQQSKEVMGKQHFQQWLEKWKVTLNKEIYRF